MKLLEALSRMDLNPSMPSFFESEWCNGVKILKCKDDPSQTWVREAARTISNLWKNAKLELMDRSCGHYNVSIRMCWLATRRCWAWRKLYIKMDVKAPSFRSISRQMTISTRGSVRWHGVLEMSSFVLRNATTSTATKTCWRKLKQRRISA